LRSINIGTEIGGRIVDQSWTQRFKKDGAGNGYLVQIVFFFIKKTLKNYMKDQYSEKIEEPMPIICQCDSTSTVSYNGNDPSQDGLYHCSFQRGFFIFDLRTQQDRKSKT
jgi:hypothetical protein